jgi:hypothetical protein
MHTDTANYHVQQSADDRRICDVLASEIERVLPKAENKVWHAHAMSGSTPATALQPSRVGWISLQRLSASSAGAP